jgi:hypothetical protein
MIDGITMDNRVADGTIKNAVSYTIVGGIPAKPIKKRFTDIQIEKLLKLKWWNWDIKKIEKYAPKFIDINKFLESVESL